ncbi:hypothetical protein MPTK2_1g21110 [Marchantia polymorpha subsp. ruderalis]
MSSSHFRVWTRRLLRELLRPHTYLMEVMWDPMDMRPEEWSELRQAIRENATPRTIRLIHFMHHRDNLKGVEELACSDSSDVKDSTVELIITF